MQTEKKRNRNHQPVNSHFSWRSLPFCILNTKKAINLMFRFFFHYRYMTRKVALVLMSSGWLVGFLIASIPIIWNNWEYAHECEFDQIFHPWYMAGVITPIFSLVWFTLIFVYWRIWREASKHCKQIRIGGQLEGPSDWKSVQVREILLFSSNAIKLKP